MCVCLCSEPNSSTSVWSGHQNNGYMRITWQKQIQNVNTQSTDFTDQKFVKITEQVLQVLLAKNFQKFGETSTTTDCCIDTKLLLN